MKTTWLDFIVVGLLLALLFVLSLFLDGCQNRPAVVPVPPPTPGVLSAPFLSQAIIFPPPPTNDLNVSFEWSWAGDPTVGFVLGYGTNYGVYSGSNSFVVSPASLVLTNGASNVWYFAVAAIDTNGVQGGWSNVARYPEWPANMLGVSWDRVDWLNVWAATNGAAWVLVTNTYGTNVALTLDPAQTLVWFRGTTTNPPPVRLQVRPYFDWTQPPFH